MIRAAWQPLPPEVSDDIDADKLKAGEYSYGKNPKPGSWLSFGN